MLKITVILLFVILIKVNCKFPRANRAEFHGSVLGPYHHIVIQIFDNADILVPPIVTVEEGVNLTLNCRTLHLIYHPGDNYYDEDIIWSRAQNWRLQRMHQKSIQNIQKNAKLMFESVSLEDQGRYICTSLKYHTSRILYIIVESKNRTEQYFRKRRDLNETTTVFLEREANKTVSCNNGNVLSMLLPEGTFRRRPHLIFIMIALALISLTFIFMVVAKLCTKCNVLRKRNRTLSEVYFIPIASFPYTRVYEN